MVNKDTCDLSQAEQRAFWLRKAFDGFIDGGLAGPPCETWSSARHHELNGAMDPRPLRDLLHLWGKPGLSLRESRQIFVGNVLLTFSLLFLYIMWLRGRWFLLEHPREPIQQERASIWRVPFVRMLMNLPNIQRFLLYQGLYGGWSPKPTHVLVTHAGDGFSPTARACETTNMPKALKMGKEANTSYYATAKLKEYPGALNYFFAVAFRDWTCSNPLTESPRDLSPADLELFQSLVVTEEDSSRIFGPDFAG